MGGLSLFALTIISPSCTKQNEHQDWVLPILGEKKLDTATGDTIYHTIQDFVMVDQQRGKVTRKALEGKISVVDFFFTSCPTICPKMTGHLKVVQEHFSREDDIQIISYSINPEHDTPDKLLSYAKAYDIDNNSWSLLTGNKEDIFSLSKSFKVRAFDDSQGEQTNLIHDGTFVLLDEKQRIRGYYNGLDLSDTQRMIADIYKLLAVQP